MRVGAPTAECGENSAMVGFVEHTRLRGSVGNGSGSRERRKAKRT